MKYKVTFEEILTVIRTSRGIVEADSEEEAHELAIEDEFEDVDIINESIADISDFEILSIEEYDSANS